MDEAKVGSVLELCEVLEVNRSAYYFWLNGSPSDRTKEDAMLSLKVIQIFWHHRSRYGARRIADELKDQGYICDRKRVGKLMNSLGIRAIQPKSCKPRSTESRHRLGYNKNLLIDVEIKGIGQAWVLYPYC